MLKSLLAAIALIVSLGGCNDATADNYQQQEQPQEVAPKIKQQYEIRCFNPAGGDMVTVISDDVFDSRNPMVRPDNTRRTYQQFTDSMSGKTYRVSLSTVCLSREL